MKTFFKILIVIYNVTFITYNSSAQTYPVQVTTQLTPPFSGYISDYSSPGNENFKVLIYLTDFTFPVYDVKLKIKLDGQGITIQSKPFYYSSAFSLLPGQPLQLSGSDLAGLLNSNNLDFSGISKSQYDLRKVLPEGYYKICITAYDNNNPTQIKVSNEGCAMAWMVLSDPPFLNTPICNSTVTITNPQNITFNWTPMNMGSPNSAANTEYEFNLYEIRPDGQNPNNIIQTLPPVFTTTVNTPFFNYGITETPLIAGMQYVWRVKAMDITGRDLFKNNGYSQICTFSWGTKYDGMGNLDIFLGATPLTHRSAKMIWDSIPVFTSYRLEYRKAGGNWNWMPLNTTNVRAKVFDLEPSTAYEARVNGTTNDGYTGQWSNTVAFTTPAAPIINCEDVAPPPTMAGFQPLTKANIGMLWNIGQFEMVITSLQNTQSSNGQYTGQGRVILPFGGLGIAGTFTNITVNNNQIVVQGSVDAITKGVDKWMQQHNDNNEYVYDDSYNYAGCIDSIYVNTNNQVVIRDCNGQTIIIPNDTNGGLLITDANGHQWIVNSDGSVTPVSGAMLPITSAPLTADELDILKKALIIIKNQYTDEIVSSAKQLMLTKSQDIENFINTQKQAYSNTNTNSVEKAEFIGFYKDDNLTGTGMQKNKDYKLKEFEYNVAKVLNMFSRVENTDAQYNFIGQYLTVSSKAYKTFITEEKAKSRTHDDIASDVAQLGIKPLGEAVAKRKMKFN